MSHPSDYESHTFTVLQKTEDSVLVRNERTGKRGWMSKKDTIRARKISSAPLFGTYEVTAQRWVFQRAGLL